ncbi:hypothetical protein P879_01676 [Paragonimus westermani]|uniref:Transcription factor TFIIIB component B'' Myb domain-containing protein n=1 Tax=Paragonimus westermani TaxID=34504 RepID=A0A8T0DSJ2_9TREM|nr:hypothetical protein P879_01676 [Paragonimus westermani]
MPKVFRPKIVQPAAKTTPQKNDSSIRSPVHESRQKPSSPLQSPVHSTAPQQSVVHPLAQDISSTSSPTNEPIRYQQLTAVDIDQTTQTKPPDPVPTAQVNLFAPKKVKRPHAKVLSDPVPDVDKPIDRSKVSLRSLLRWTPVNKPPPKYRQDRSTVSSENSHMIQKQDAELLKSETPQLPIDEPTPSVDMLAPQLRLDADGNIVIDETSLMVSLPETPVNASNVRRVSEDTGILSVTYKSFRSPPEKSGGRWKGRETVRFYRALSTIGPDFYLMTTMFPNRTRTELKRKFKRESRTNPYLVNQTLRSRRSYDLSALVPLSDEDDEETVPCKPKDESVDSAKLKVKPGRVRAKPEADVHRRLKRKNEGAHYNPDRVYETIDSVLTQIAAEALPPPCSPHSDQPDLLTYSYDTVSHPNYIITDLCPTSNLSQAPVAISPQQPLLARMIAHKVQQSKQGSASLTKAGESFDQTLTDASSPSDLSSNPPEPNSTGSVLLSGV